MSDEKYTVVHMPHHAQQKLCQSRPLYRQGKKLTAIKVVYTINDESQHLLIHGVPQLQLAQEVRKLIYSYGNVKAIQLVTEYPSEEFTETYHVHYTRIQSARIAKRLIDNKNFFGGFLHVCYAPELETLDETKSKLIQRRKDVATQIKRIQQELMNPGVDKFIPREQYHRKKKTPTLPLTEERIKHFYPGETLSSICNGMLPTRDLRPVSAPRLSINWKSGCNSTVSSAESYPMPYQSTEVLMQTGSQQANRNLDSNVQKQKNYRVRCIDKVKVVRPRLIDTRNITRLNFSEKTNVFCNVKKVESKITIKLMEKPNNEKKKIVIKNPRYIYLCTHIQKISKRLATLKCKRVATKLEIRKLSRKLKTARESREKFCKISIKK
ncbi:RBM48 protein, partial [Pseudoatta argentina]